MRACEGRISRRGTRQAAGTEWWGAPGRRSLCSPPRTKPTRPQAARTLPTFSCGLPSPVPETPHRGAAFGMVRPCSAQTAPHGHFTGRRPAGGRGRLFRLAPRSLGRGALKEASQGAVPLARFLDSPLGPLTRFALPWLWVIGGQGLSQPQARPRPGRSRPSRRRSWGSACSHSRACAG